MLSKGKDLAIRLNPAGVHCAKNAPASWPGTQTTFELQAKTQPSPSEPTKLGCAGSRTNFLDRCYNPLEPNWEMD